MVSGPGQGHGGMFEADRCSYSDTCEVTQEAGLREGQQLDSVERASHWEG